MYAIFSTGATADQAAHQALRSEFISLRPIVLRHSFEKIFEETKDYAHDAEKYFSRCCDVLWRCTHKGQGIDNVIEQITYTCVTKEEWETIPGRLFLEVFLNPLLSVFTEYQHTIMVWDTRLSRWIEQGQLA